MSLSTMVVPKRSKIFGFPGRCSPKPILRLFTFRVFFSRTKNSFGMRLHEGGSREQGLCLPHLVGRRLENQKDITGCNPGNFVTYYYG